MALDLRNPHSVLAALQTRPQDVVEVRHSEQPSGAWRDVLQMAATNRVPVGRGAARQDKGRRNRRDQPVKTGRMGSAHASVKPRGGVDLEQLFSAATERQAGHGLWLALDQLQDPHNVGAVFRSAAFFGVDGIVLTKDRSASLSATVYDTAAGGLEYVPFACVTNLSRALETAKKRRLWVLGTSEHAENDVFAIDRDRPWLLVLGNEEKGLRRLTKDKCDEMCRLTPRGEITSLNVSVAAGALIAALTPSV